MNALHALYALFWLNFRRIYLMLPTRLRRKCLVAFIGMMALACLEVTVMLSISFLAMSISAPEAALSFGFMPRLLNVLPAVQHILADPRNLALFGSCYVTGLLTLKNLTSYLVQYWTTCLGELVGLDIGERLFGNYLYRHYLDFLAGKSANLHAVIGMRGAVGQYLVACMTVHTYCAAFIALLLLLVSQTPLLLLSVLGLVGVTAMLVYLWIKRAVDRDGQQLVHHSLQEHQSLSNAIGGLREIIIYRQQEVFLDIFRRHAGAKIRPQTFLAVSSGIPSLVIESVSFFAIPCMLVVLISWYQAPMTEIAASLSMILLFCWRVLPMLNRSLSCLVLMRSLHSQAFRCLDEVESLEEGAAVPPISDDALRVTKNISLHEVSFRYPGKEQPALDGISCDAPLGRRIGIVGLSGAGKSTLAAVLAGLVAPDGGRMLVDGDPLEPAALAAYRRRIGYVPQSAFIMNGTLAQNIAFSEWGRPIDEQKVLRAAKLAALDFLHDSPQGIDMPLSAGSQLSGGQMQRVSIARALYVSPQVLILDESTSALDLATERAVLQTIESLPGDLIVFVIAHRLSTVERCDEIWWLDQGRLRRRGPTADVLPAYTAWLSERA